MKSYFYVICLIFLTKIGTTFSSDMLVNCIYSIVDKQHRIEKKKFFTNFDIRLKYSVYKATPDADRKIFGNVKFDIFIINLRLVDLESFLSWESERESFNPRASYLLFAADVSSIIYAMFAKYYIREVYVITKNSVIFTYDPYKYESVNNPDTTPTEIGNCNNFSKDVKLSKGTMPKLWRNTTFIDCFRPLEPYTTLNNDGLENKFIEVVQGKMGFKRKSIVLPHVVEHTVEPLSTEGVRLLKKRKADVLIGFNAPQEDSPKYFELSICFYTDYLAWVSPFAPLRSYWKRIAKIFPKEFWWYLVSSLSTWVIMVRCMHQISIFKLITVLYQILLENSVPQYHIKNKFYYKIMLAAWMIGFLVISTLFKNILLIILGTQSRERQLTTTKQVVAATSGGLRITSYVNLANFYIAPQGLKEYPIDFSNIEYCESAIKCVNRTAFWRDTISVAPKSIVRYNWIPKFYITNHGEVLVSLSKEIIKPLFIHLIFPKGHPLFDQINDVLVRTVASGWFQHVYNEMRLKIKRATSPLVFEAQKIGMNKFNCVFLVWAFGLFSSLVVFCFELGCYKVN